MQFTIPAHTHRAWLLILQMQVNRTKQRLNAQKPPRSRYGQQLRDVAVSLFLIADRGSDPDVGRGIARQPALYPGEEVETCGQVFPVQMCEADFCVMPKRSAMSFTRQPLARRRLIDTTSTSDTCAFG